MAAAQTQPMAYCGCAPQRMMAECINPNHENSAAMQHQAAARAKLRLINSVSTEAITKTRNRNPLPSRLRKNRAGGLIPLL